MEQIGQDNKITMMLMKSMTSRFCRHLAIVAWLITISTSHAGQLISWDLSMDYNEPPGDTTGQTTNGSPVNTSLESYYGNLLALSATLSQSTITFDPGSQNLAPRHL